MSPFPQRQVSPTASRLRLRELMAGPEPLEMPGPYDAASAQLIARIGAQALWAGGNVSSAGRLGVPDVNLMTMTEQLEFCTSIVDATGLPVLADTDDGYGQALMVTRTVQAFERAGLAAIQMEDQASPKRCAWYPGEPVGLIPREQMVGKIKAAVDARSDEAMMIWARTDALPALRGTGEAVERAHAWVDAGADAVLITSKSLDDLGEIARNWGRPQPLCMTSYNFPALTRDGVKALGYSVRVHPMSAILAALRGVERVFTELYETGSFAEAIADGLPLAELLDLTGQPDAEDLDGRFRAISEGRPAVPEGAPA